MIKHIDPRVPNFALRGARSANYVALRADAKCANTSNTSNFKAHIFCKDMARYTAISMTSNMEVLLHANSTASPWRMHQFGTCMN